MLHVNDLNEHPKVSLDIIRLFKYQMSINEIPQTFIIFTVNYFIATETSASPDTSSYLTITWYVTWLILSARYSLKVTLNYTRKPRNIQNRFFPKISCWTNFLSEKQMCFYYTFNRMSQYGEIEFASLWLVSCSLGSVVRWERRIVMIKFG